MNKYSAEHQRQIADYAEAYRNGKPADHAPWLAFVAINHVLFNTLPVHIEFVNGQPYDHQIELARDVWHNGRIRVSREFAGDHEIWSELDNLEFRAVHDFHHVMSDGRFTWLGDVTACQSHLNALREVSPYDLKPVFESECLGQVGQATFDGVFPPQHARIVAPDNSVLE